MTQNPSEILSQLYGSDGFDTDPDRISLSLIAKKNAESLGQYGGVITSDTSTVTGNFSSIQVLADAVFSNIIINGVSGTLTGFTIPAGEVIRGDISSYKLTSGKVIAYNSSTTYTADSTPILDEYTNVVFAYSFIKLFSNYNGPCIRVRRTPLNDEADIGFDTTGKLDIAALLDFVGTGDGFIRKKYDLSGNNRHIDQPDTSLQPKIVSSGSFNESGALFTNDNLPINTNWLTGDYTLLVREAASSITTNNRFLETSTGISNTNIIMGYADANTFSATLYSDTLTYDNPSVNFPVDAKRVWAATSAGSTKKVYLNGTQIATT